MTASLPTKEVRFAELAEALQQEIQAGPTDATKSIRVRHGLYSLRGKPGHYIIRIRISGCPNSCDHHLGGSRVQRGARGGECAA